MYSSLQARMGPGGLGFKYSGESSKFETPKVALGRRLKKMPETCKERLWESSPRAPPQAQALQRQAPLGSLRVALPLGKGSSHLFPQPKAPLEKSLAGAMPSFWLGAGPRRFLAGSSWALAPVGLAPLLHKHTPPPSSVLLPDGRSLMPSPHFGPFSFSFDFFSLPCFLPRPSLSRSFALSLALIHSFSLH